MEVTASLSANGTASRLDLDSPFQDGRSGNPRCSGVFLPSTLGVDDVGRCFLHQGMPCALGSKCDLPHLSPPIAPEAVLLLSQHKLSLNLPTLLIILKVQFDKGRLRIGSQLDALPRLEHFCFVEGGRVRILRQNTPAFR